MYPGYSPADHEYGKAAEEYGKAVAEARKRGVEIPKHPDIEYQIGQGKGIKRDPLVQMREMGGLKEQQSGSRSRSGSGEDEGPNKKQKTNGHIVPAEVKTEETNTKETDAPPEGNNPYFVIDTNPTPVNLLAHISSPSKREADTEPVEGKKSKKSKKKHSGNFAAAPVETEATEDISAEVDARLKEKEEKRKQKEEKKRKRESEKSDIAATETGETTIGSIVGEVEKPKKKKKKVMDAESGEELPDRTMEKKRVGEKGDDEGKKKKWKKRKG